MAATAIRTTDEEVIISADSHVSENGSFWVERVPAEFRDVAPRFPERQLGVGFQGHPGGYDPKERIKEMSEDTVSAEVLYPTLGLRLFGLDDATLQEACFRAYNDWLIEYCSVAPDRLVGLSCISAYYIDHAVAGNICRCATYQRIRAAIHAASAQLAG